MVINQPLYSGLQKQTKMKIKMMELALAVEYGYRQAEKGHNIQMALKNFSELMGEPETAGVQPEPTQIEKDFYMNICRAYNAGKDNMVRTINGATFISSHTYFTGEFPEFKTNVP